MWNHIHEAEHGMASLTVQMDQEALSAATQQAIAGAIPPEVAQKLVQQAIEALLRPSTDRWDNNISPLARAFYNAVERYANIKVHEMVDHDVEFRKQLDALLKQVVQQMLTKDPDKLADKLSSAFVAAISKE